MQSQLFAVTGQCRCAQRPMNARQLRHATKLSLRNKPVAFTCHSQAPSRLPEVCLRNNLVRDPQINRLQDAVFLQTTSRPEFFPKQAHEVKEQAALDFMSRMQRSTVDAASLTCPVETAYLGPSGMPDKSVSFMLFLCSQIQFCMSPCKSYLSMLAQSMVASTRIKHLSCCFMALTVLAWSFGACYPF